MADLIIRLPKHGYSLDDFVYVSWLNANFFVRNRDIAGGNIAVNVDSFMIGTKKVIKDPTGAAVVRFNDGLDTIQTDGYVRLLETDESSTTIDGLDHLNGEEVTVTSGGDILTAETVVGGEITVPLGTFTYQVGLPYSAKIRTMRLASPQTGSALQGQIKRINRNTVRYVKAKSGMVGQEYPVIDNDGNAVMTEFLEDADMVFDTDSRDVNLPVDGGNATDCYSVIKSTRPSPMTVVANVTEFSIEETR